MLSNTASTSCAARSRFARLFAGEPGIDPYTRVVSDVYQDLFLDANYHGKAIYDVAGFHAILDRRFPDQTLLSHDLIDHYEACLDAHGDTHRGVDWPNAADASEQPVLVG
mgnify:CR=1 FL=1